MRQGKVDIARVLPYLLIELNPRALMFTFMSYWFWCVEKWKYFTKEPQALTELQTRRKWPKNRLQFTASSQQFFILEVDVFATKYKHARDFFFRNHRIKECFVILPFYIRIRPILMKQCGLAHQRLKH